MIAKPKDFRVLLVYPNLTMMLVPSVAIALFTAVLRQAGYTVDLFDTTHYVNDLTHEVPQNVGIDFDTQVFLFVEGTGV